MDIQCEISRVQKNVSRSLCLQTTNISLKVYILLILSLFQKVGYERFLGYKQQKMHLKNFRIERQYINEHKILNIIKETILKFTLVH